MAESNNPRSFTYRVGVSAKIVRNPSQSGKF